VRELNVLKYEAAPPGSPDKYRLTEDAHFFWENCPRWIYEIVRRKAVRLDSGYVAAFMQDGKRIVSACVFKGFYFAISVARSFPRALPAGCLHDWIYANAAALAAAWGCSVRTVLHIADHWFLALMRATGFLLKRSYFIAVRMLGYTFNRLFARAKK
jgi:hypothetical protein